MAALAVDAFANDDGSIVVDRGQSARLRDPFRPCENDRRFLRTADTEDTGVMRRFFTITLTALVLCYLGAARADLAAQAKKPAKAAALKNPVPSTPESIAAGQTLFKKYCRFCHGDDAKGNGPQAPKDTHPPDLTDAKWDYGSTDADLFAVIKDGIQPKNDMKGYNSKMTPQEMWSVVNYLRSIGPKGAPR